MTDERSGQAVVLAARVVGAALALAAVGALAFGLWHVVVGGLINGNPRAASFGVVLALIAGAFLVGLALGRRAWRRSG